MPYLRKLSLAEIAPAEQRLRPACPDCAHVRRPRGHPALADLHPATTAAQRDLAVGC